MESSPIGLTLKENNNKKEQQQKSEAKNEIVNEIVLNQIITLLIKTTMEECGFFPKSNYFNESKNDDIFPQNYIFSKIFPNFTAFFENLDLKFSEIMKNDINKKNEYILKSLKKYILDQNFLWNCDIVNYIGYYWDTLDKKIKIHTIIFLSMVDVFVNKYKLNEYDKNILYWTILFHDVGKFHEMNTIYKEDYSKNKFVDKAHPLKSGIIFIQTALNKNLIFFKDENEKKEFINFFENQFIKASYESFKKEENKFNNLIYNLKK